MALRKPQVDQMAQDQLRDPARGDTAPANSPLNPSNIGEGAGNPIPWKDNVPGDVRGPQDGNPNPGRTTYREDMAPEGSRDFSGEVPYGEDTAQDVTDAHQRVLDATVALDAAKADEKDAAEAHRVATEPYVVRGQHLLIERSNGNHIVRDVPAEWTDKDGNFSHQRTVLLDGANYEHVADHASGAWIYRRM